MITDDEARAILTRFNNSHWDNPGEKARYSIPARPDYDDDLRLAQYIKETRAMRAALSNCQDLLRAALAHMRFMNEGRWGDIIEISVGKGWSASARAAVHEPIASTEPEPK